MLVYQAVLKILQKFQVRKLQQRDANLTTMFLQPFVVARIPEEISYNTEAGQQICRNCWIYSDFLNHFQ